VLKQGIVADDLFDPTAALDPLDCHSALLQLQPGHCQGNFLVEWMVWQRIQAVKANSQDR
jgi:hypothetical protein